MVRQEALSHPARRMRAHPSMLQILIVHFKIHEEQQKKKKKKSANGRAVASQIIGLLKRVPFRVPHKTDEGLYEQRAHCPR